MKNRIIKSLLIASSSVLAAGGSYALISPKQDYQPDSVLGTTLDSNKISASANAAPLSNKANRAVFEEIHHTIQSGESLSSIFHRLDLKLSDLNKILYAPEKGKRFAAIKSGAELIAYVDDNKDLKQLVYKRNSIDSLVATRTQDSFEIKDYSTPISRVIASTQATIDSSLFLAGKKAALPDKVIMELANIFAWDVDFALNLRNGDQFTVVYEKLFIDDQEIGTGNIVSAEFVNQGKTFTTVRYEDENGESSYYTPEGKSMRKAFLRTPIDFARVSSHFNLKRRHPVLNKIRAHKGVDYAARTGTPIKSAGDGKIKFRGWKSGYGRVVIVQHGQKYTTLYAHLSKFKSNQKNGSHVQQGDVIGYVGKSGLATGPHLHYEFRVNGVHRNPLTVKLPNSTPIPETTLAAFKNQTQPWLELLNKAKSENLLAQNSQE